MAICLRSVLSLSGSESEITTGWVAEGVYRICAFPGLAVLRPAKPPPARVPILLSDLLRCRFTRVTARSALRAAPSWPLTTWARRSRAKCFAQFLFPVTPGITRSALRIPVPMGPNPGRWSYGVVAVLDERYGISDHPVTTVPP